MQQEVQLLGIVFVEHRRAQLVEEPTHDKRSENYDQPPWPGLVLVYVFYYVYFSLQTYTHILSDTFITTKLTKFQTYNKICTIP